VVLDCPGGDYVLALPPFRKDQRTWQCWHASVVAGPACRALQHALCNHSCRDATVLMQRPSGLHDCALPCAVVYAPSDMPAGGHLLWDYDGGAHAGNRAFSVDLALSTVLRLEGVNTVPCACYGERPCPLKLPEQLVQRLPRSSGVLKICPARPGHPSTSCRHFTRAWRLVGPLAGPRRLSLNRAGELRAPSSRRSCWLRHSRFSALQMRLAACLPRPTARSPSGAPWSTTLELQGLCQRGTVGRSYRPSPPLGSRGPWLAGWASPLSTAPQRQCCRRAGTVSRRWRPCAGELIHRAATDAEGALNSLP
jgi:hypothetical protein